MSRALVGLDQLPRSPVIRIIRPFQAFAENKASGGVLLLVCTVVALVLANSPWADSYNTFWHTDLTISVGGRALSHDLHFWVNDLLMAIFFFVVGLEIKREVLVGELASVRNAAFPVAAAAGGAVVPAAIYHLMNRGGPGATGWGVPMATDIAFVLGVMALLGDRVPLGLKVFLTALAIVDDIAAVLVIAVFYTAQIYWSALLAAGICLLVLFGLNRLGARHPLTYAGLGALLWLAVLASGVHATIAGVALAFTVPARTPLNSRDFLVRSRRVLDHFERATESERTIINDEDQQAALHALEEACEKVQPPLQRLEHDLHPWVTFLIMPLFALANAGVVLRGDMAATFTQPVTLGVILGLLVGKPIGILAGSWLLVRTGFTSLPNGITWAHVHAAGWLGGIGFTMSLFIAALAFTDDALLTMSKLGILVASLLAGIVGSVLLIRQPRPELQSDDVQMDSTGTP
ncbi:MAG TPA: Na+/H+ antiporter NhaA [Bryobacteraceae bacterium]|nr:Na+/H+ antiporter NhaA [Bryobacteraceae bacterium]